MHSKGLLGFLFPEMAEHDPVHNYSPAGQGCGGIHEVQSCQEIVDEIMSQAETLLARGLVASAGERIKAQA